MKKVLIWLSVIAIAVIALDIASGAAFRRHMQSHTLPGDYEAVEQLLRDFDYDMVVLGSSVALNSINTGTISDSVHTEAYNGGANGQTFPFYLTMLKAIIGQKCPRKVILAMIPDNLSDEGPGKRYNLLAPYYGLGISDIDERLAGEGTAENLFVKSSFYRLNKIWFRILLYHFISPNEKGERGFLIKPVPPSFPQRRAQDEEMAMSDERREELDEFARLCRDNGIDLTMVFTPTCMLPVKGQLPLIKEAGEIMGKYGFTMHDDSYLPPFASDSTMFFDTNHLNINGSKIYTDTIISRLKSTPATTGWRDKVN